MKQETFVRRLEDGKSNRLTYSTGGKEGLISTWKHLKSYVLTWEECPAGQQYDESEYTRDERHEFAGVEKLIAFLAEHDIDIESFAP